MPNPALLRAPVELTLPADRDLMLVVRLTAAGVAARAGVTVDRMDEIKMAIEEACGCMIEQANPPARLRLRFCVEAGRLAVSAEGLDAAIESGDTGEAELDVMRCILDALVDRAEFTVRNGWIARVDVEAALPM